MSPLCKFRLKYPIFCFSDPSRMNLRPHFSSPANFVLFLGEDNTAYIWGEHYSGSLGLGRGATSQKSPVKLSLPLLAGEHLQDAAFGAYHTLVLTSHQRVIVWGRNDHGQLGTANQSEQSSPAVQPRFLPAGETISKVRCGYVPSNS
jgi:alpha-tubulin suppressor-like RCC1 family protein